MSQYKLQLLARFFYNFGILGLNPVPQNVEIFLHLLAVVKQSLRSRVICVALKFLLPVTTSLFFELTDGAETVLVNLDFTRSLVLGFEACTLFQGLLDPGAFLNLCQGDSIGDVLLIDHHAARAHVNNFRVVTNRPVLVSGFLVLLIQLNTHYLVLLLGFLVLLAAHRAVLKKLRV